MTAWFLVQSNLLLHPDAAGIQGCSFFFFHPLSLSTTWQPSKARKERKYRLLWETLYVLSYLCILIGENCYLYSSSLMEQKFLFHFLPLCPALSFPRGWTILGIDRSRKPAGGQMPDWRLQGKPTFHVLLSFHSITYAIFSKALLVLR